MDTKFNGKIWTFGDDIDTDTIIPGKRGTIPTIEEMKRYAFELLKPEFGTAVKPGGHPRCGQELWLRIFPGTGCDRSFSQWGALHHRKELCPYLLPQRLQ